LQEAENHGFATALVEQYGERRGDVFAVDRVQRAVQVDVAVLARIGSPVQLQDVAVAEDHRRVALLDADEPRPLAGLQVGARLAPQPYPGDRPVVDQLVEQPPHQLAVLRRVVHAQAGGRADVGVLQMVGRLGTHGQQQLVGLLAHRDHGVHETGVAVDQHGRVLRTYGGSAVGLRPIPALPDDPVRQRLAEFLGQLLRSGHKGSPSSDSSVFSWNQ
jgi:hypothetical protein